MITNALIYSAWFILSFFVEILPVSTGFPSEVETAFQYLGGYAGMLDPLLPISTLASVLVILFAFEAIVFGFKTLTWIFSKIPIFGK